MKFLVLALATAISALPQAALAHTFGAHDAGFAHGFLHPVGGWDHLLAMVAVGLWAAQRGGRPLWALPLAFVGAMVAGGTLGMAGLELPAVETGILLSVLVFGALIAFAVAMPLPAAAAVVALFGVFHGHAHGVEMPEAAQPMLYAAGFVLATALLHTGGIIAAAAALRSVRGGLGSLAVRGAGAAVGLGGAALAVLG